jgi:phosphoenolpyruvate carboxykinase (GTP)
VTEAFDWTHGVFLGATLASETTAAAVGTTGVVRDDPMAMLPFCGYHMGDYFAHWLAMGERLSHPPKMFRVNWFRTDETGRFLWPGFGENLRVLQWIIERCEGRGAAVETPLGFLPADGAVDREGLSLTDETWRTLVAINREGWHREAERQAAFLTTLGDRVPTALHEAQRTQAEQKAGVRVRGR